MIASDIHGSAKYCRLLLEAYKKEKAAKLVLLGDILYHGPRNPLPEEYSPQTVAALLSEVKQDILCVRGNCDSEVDQMVLDFPLQADFGMIALPHGTAVLAHGHKSPARLNDGDILINGHFHVPAFEKREGYLYVNCGSVSIPKENSPHSYLVLEEGTLTWKNAETGDVFRTEYI